MRCSFLKINILLIFESTPSTGASLMVQWIGLHAFTAEHRGLIPG